MKHISLFSGIGGFDLAAQWMGWENVAHCEFGAFGRRVLNYYWPKSDSYIDIKTADFTKYHGTIDIISGGFPCQPYSQAGKRLGKADDRHLWPEMLRAIREVKPRWVLGENVLGLVNWSGGMVFDEVQSDLEAEGYQVQAFVLPAASKNAPHQRQRVWIVAYSNGSYDRRTPRQNEGTGKCKGLQKRHKIRKFGKSSKIFGIIANSNQNSGRCANSGRQEEEKQLFGRYSQLSKIGAVTNANHARAKQHMRNNKEWQKENQKRIKSFDKLRKACGNVTNANSRRQPSQKHRQTKSRWFTETSFSDYWQNFPTQSPVCSGDDGFSSRLDRETIYEGFNRPITFAKWRNESIKAYGNAVVPQVVLEIFKAIQTYENM